MKGNICGIELDCIPMFIDVNQKMGPRRSAVFSTILDKCIQNDWHCTISQQELADKTHQSRKGIIRMLHDLRAAGYIEYTKRGGRGMKLTYSIPEKDRQYFAEMLRDEKW